EVRSRGRHHLPGRHRGVGLGGIPAPRRRVDGGSTGRLRLRAADLRHLCADLRDRGRLRLHLHPASAGDRTGHRGGVRPVTRRGRAGTSPTPVLASVAAVALLVTGCGSPPEPARVTVRNVAFDPRELHVVAGDEVAWFFDDGGTYHDVVVEGLDGNA